MTSETKPERCAICGHVENYWQHVVTHEPVQVEGAHQFSTTIGRTPEWREHAFAGSVETGVASQEPTVCPDPADCCRELTRVWAALGNPVNGHSASENVTLAITAARQQGREEMATCAHCFQPLTCNAKLVEENSGLHHVVDQAHAERDALRAQLEQLKAEKT